MKFFSSEFSQKYDSYTFAYANYAILESLEEVPIIYDKGYLPYSGLPIDEEIYYMSRSLRVNLSEFKISSENKRLLKKYDPLEIEMKIVDKDEFLKEERNFDFCLKYTQNKFEKEAFGKKRLQYIFDRKCGNKVIVFTKDDELIGVVLACLQGNTLHYWFCFYDLDFKENIPLGKTIMTKVILWAKENNLDYVYLGTIYGVKSLYKVRDYSAVEYFEGNKWANDIDRLKAWTNIDDDTFEMDKYKQEHIENGTIF